MGGGVGVGCSVDRAEVMAFVGCGRWSYCLGRGRGNVIRWAWDVLLIGRRQMLFVGHGQSARI